MTTIPAASEISTLRGVAHNISVINVQANTALHLIDRQPERAAIALSTIHEVSKQALDGLRAGAAGFLVKDTDAAELLRAIRVVAGGEALLSPTVTRRLVAEFTARAREVRQVAGIGELTPREHEVVALVADGLSNAEIAGRWHVSESTVKTHVNRAMMKLAARDRAQLVVLAYQSGLARAGW